MTKRILFYSERANLGCDNLQILLIRSKVSSAQSPIIKKMAACRSTKLFFANLRWRHVMTVENILSHQFIDDWLSFHAHKQLYCGKQKQKLL